MTASSAASTSTRCRRRRTVAGRCTASASRSAGASFYHQGSANLIEDEIRPGGVDFFLAGVAGRGFTRDYWRRILPRLDPQTVIPTHYDDFFRPLDQPMGFTTNVNLARVPDEIASGQPRHRGGGAARRGGAR